MRPAEGLQRAGLFRKNDGLGPATIPMQGPGHESWASESFNSRINLDSTKSLRRELTQEVQNCSAFATVPREPEGVVAGTAFSQTRCQRGLARVAAGALAAVCEPEDLCPPRVSVRRASDRLTRQVGPAGIYERGLESGSPGARQSAVRIGSGRALSFTERCDPSV